MHCSKDIINFVSLPYVSYAFCTTWLLFVQNFQQSRTTKQNDKNDNHDVQNLDQDNTRLLNENDDNIFAADAHQNHLHDQQELLDNISENQTSINDESISNESIIFFWALSLFSIIFYILFLSSECVMFFFYKCYKPLDIEDEAS